MAELEQLGVGIFEQLNDRVRTGRAVIEKRAIPADHSQIVRIIRDARLQDFLIFAIRKRYVFAPNDLGNASTFSRQQSRSRRIPRNIAHMKDKVVLVEPLVIELNQRRAGTLDLLLNDLLGEAREVGIPHPTAREADERVPVS